MKTPVFLLLLATLLVSCGGKKGPEVRILPGEDGLHRAVVHDKNKQEALKAATADAHAFCKGYGKMAVFKDEKSDYQGTFGKEGDKAVKTAGAIGTVFGVHDAEEVGDILTDDSAYDVTVHFKCLNP